MHFPVVLGFLKGNKKWFQFLNLNFQSSNYPNYLEICKWIAHKSNLFLIKKCFKSLFPGVWYKTFVSRNIFQPIFRGFLHLVWWKRVSVSPKMSDLIKYMPKDEIRSGFTISLVVAIKSRGNSLSSHQKTTFFLISCWFCHLYRESSVILSVLECEKQCWMPFWHFLILSQTVSAKFGVILYSFIQKSSFFSHFLLIYSSSYLNSSVIVFILSTLPISINCSLLSTFWDFVWSFFQLFPGTR